MITQVSYHKAAEIVTAIQESSAASLMLLAWNCGDKQDRALQDGLTHHGSPAQ